MRLVNMGVEMGERAQTQRISIHPMDMRDGGMVCLRNDESEKCVGFLHDESGQFERFIIVTHVGEGFEGSKPWEGVVLYDEDSAYDHLEELLGRPLEETVFLTAGDDSEPALLQDHLYPISDIVKDIVGQPFTNN